ncbi:T6SS phospholipase effector Tle1-like catalytic domain-containing protein [Rodentibacter pneumotropicus]|nr:DUF2235 domain-containing protein [Rodentibacter pneumotropicus]MDC2825060.1 DUF2235 domain-containing protein [Rodentibacter pneumotropicus]NBH75484.1 DUF2235 domain-containing protein [Rodentibacter pneumotropicus]OOF63487.1 hypothetical protein BH925_08270 [Rodentibacter pneumotropicus]THA01090.1 DUF2235 domain-containing protein [Rodentibacter pneumotropicus]THA03592.1 DUF2235 domain-containing protein [Rodentibacter pneumotropicus]
MTCQVIRIGVFFDGTGNNLSNDEVGRSKNGVSNIGKLYRLYRDGERFKGQKITECEIVVKAIYIEGVGTINGNEDYSSGGAFGTLGGQRISRAISQIKTILAKYPAREYQQQIDVFGFSRGAAMARDFINSLSEDDEIKGIFKFVGLFDTVGSFGFPGDDKNWKAKTKDFSEGNLEILVRDIFDSSPPEKYYEPYNFNLSPQSAEQIVHFVAMDEYRKNFPLTNTNGAGLTYEFIGAHSDVGGGYASVEKEKIADVFDKKKSNQENEKSLLLPAENDIQIGENWKCGMPITSSPYQFLGVKYCKGERTVTDDLQKVALIAMYRLAIKAGVPFKKNIHDKYPDIPEPNIPDEQGYTEEFEGNLEQNMQALGWTKELQNYCTIATRNITELHDFLNEGEKRTNGGQGALRADRNIPHLKILAKYAHHSAGIFKDEVYLPAPLGFKHRLYNNTVEDIAKSPLNRDKQTKIPKRNIFDNNPRLAVIKKD